MAEGDADEDAQDRVRGSFGRRFRAANGDRRILELFAIAALLVSLLSTRLGVVRPVIAIVLAIVLLATLQFWPLKRASVSPAGAYVVPRILLVIALGVSSLQLGRATRSIDAHGVIGASPVGWLTVGILLLLVTLESTYTRIARGVRPLAHGLPGVPSVGSSALPTFVVFYANVLAIVLAWILLAAGLDPVALVIALCDAALLAYGAADNVLRIRTRRHADARLRRVVTAYAPRFVLHWSAPANAGHQVATWLPFLERIGAPYIVIARERGSFAQAVALTDRPVVLCSSLAELDGIVVPSITTAFYVNNGMKNAHLVRNLGIKHVQLLHGDSDKAPSYSPVNRMYDKHFVAGQAAIDRYAAHGVDVSPGLFEIVGRPQVEGILVGVRGRADGVGAGGAGGGTTASGASAGAGGATRVLYAPTWAGFNRDAAHSSLPIGVAIVRALLERGCEVIFRPHPYTDRTPEFAAIAGEIRSMLAADAEAHGRAPGHAHVWGERAERGLSLIECFNDVDALVTDVSSVLPDFLYSEKPFAVTAMLGDLDEFEQHNPIAAGGYVIDAAGANLGPVLDRLLGADDKHAARLAVKTLYLGDIPADEYVSRFVTVARAIVERPDAPGAVVADS